MVIQLPPVGEIKRFFPNHRICVVKVMVLLLNCVLQSRTVNLNKCKNKVGISTGKKDGKPSSAYTRFIRFFKIKGRDAFCLGITLLIVSLTHLSGTGYLVIDRTNWEIGSHKINVLCLGLLLPNGIFIPILWELLPKKGNSNTQERQALLSRFQKVWKGDKSYKLTLLGDREFIGLDWFVWMVDHHLSFVVRLRWQDYFHLVAAASDLTVYKLEQKIKRKVKKNGFFQSSFHYEGKLFYFTVLPNTAKRRVNHKPNPGDDYVVLLSLQKNVSLISQDYRKRWGIEVFFRHVKKNGFNLEDLNLKEQEKVQLLVGIVAIAYCLSIREGLKKWTDFPTKIKKHGAKAVSIFRNGYDNLQNSIFNLDDLIEFINCLIEGNANKVFIESKSV
jgi:Transposase DDE domain